MIDKEIYITLSNIRHLINSHGFNFEITLGVESYDNCSSTDELLSNLKKSFPGVHTESAQFIPVTSDQLWKELDSIFDYRGESGATINIKAGSRLEKRLNSLVAEYKQHLNKYLAPRSAIYYYPDERGIPGYPVWWDFRFFIHNKEGKSLFIFGSASD